MKRRLSLWRIVAIVAVAVALIATSLQSGLFPPSEQIARIRLEGVIVDDPTLADLLRKVRDDKSVKAATHINHSDADVVVRKSIPKT